MIKAWINDFDILTLSLKRENRPSFVSRDIVSTNITINNGKEISTNIGPFEKEDLIAIRDAIDLFLGE